MEMKIFVSYANPYVVSGYKFCCSVLLQGEIAERWVYEIDDCNRGHIHLGDKGLKVSLLTHCFGRATEFSA